MRANYVNLSSPEQTNQDAQYIDEAPVRIQSILIYVLENDRQYVDIYALGFSDATKRLRCFDAYDPAFKVRQQEKWICKLIEEADNEAK
jgi:hypothetical protein